MKRFEYVVGAIGGMAAITGELWLIAWGLQVEPLAPVAVVVGGTVAWWAHLQTRVARP